MGEAEPECVLGPESLRSLLFPLPRADPLAWTSRASRPPPCREGDGSSQLGGQDCTGQLSEGLGFHREAALQTLPLEMHPTCSSWVGRGTT